MGLIARALLFAGAFLASFLVSKEALNFPIISFVIALFLFMALAVLLAFFKDIVRWIAGDTQNKAP